MALSLTSNIAMAGKSDIPARAPLSDDASGYADLQSGLQITQSSHAVHP